MPRTCSSRSPITSICCSGAEGMKARLWLAFKLAVTVGLFAWVLGAVDLAAVAQTFAELDAWAIAAVIVLTFAAVGVSAWRWHRVLARLGEPVAVRTLFGDTLVGTTYNLLLPTSVGGDVVRSMRCAGRLKVPEHAWASVAFERVMGLVSLALVSCVGLLSVTTRARGELLLVSAGLAGGLVLALLVAPGTLRLAARMARRWFARWLERVAGALDRMAEAFEGPLATAGARLETFGWSLAYQLVSLAILYAAGRGWGEPELARAVFLGVPIALVISTAPVTIGGLGLRESLFVAVLVPFGLSSERAFALSLVWLASNLLAALAGAAVPPAARGPAPADQGVPS
jgi:glycosyltransferase 2 family protein